MRDRQNETTGGPGETSARATESDCAKSAAIAEILRLADAEPLRAAEQIMAHLRSPEGCPWDREQTFDSIRRHTLEEVYEVFDAIERRDWPALQDELGDLLLQVLFYAQMAKEDQRFSLTEIARSLNAKLIRRHPHIFGDVVVADSADVKQNWEAIKQAERGRRRDDSVSGPPSLLAEVPRAMPALMEARKLGSSARRASFDWPEVTGVLAKVQEELEELRAEHMAGASVTEIEEELGDLLFSVVQLSRHLDLDAEMALRRANAKFRSRFAAMETLASQANVPLASRTPDDLERLWATAKRMPREGDRG